MHIDDRIKLSHKNISLKQRYVLIKDCYLYFLLAVFCCLACSRSGSYIPEPLSKDGLITFSLVLPRLGLTKADDPTVNKDNEVDNVTLLVFEAMDDNTGKFLYRRTELDVAADNKFTVDLELTRSPIRVHIFANAPVGSLTDTYDEGAIEKDILKSIETDIDLNHSSAYTIPMHGYLDLASVLLGDIDEEVQLLRSVARVDVQVNNNIELSTFKLSGVAVYFTPNKGSLVSTSALVGTQNPYVTSPTMPTTAYAILDTEGSVPSAGITNSNYSSILNNIFIYENQDYTNIAGDNKNSRIVISGYYNGSTELSYYPVDFQKTNDTGNKEYIPILRNHKYLLTIISVMGDGYTDEELAANSEPVDITASITWDKPTEYIIFEGKNYFHIEKRSLTLYGDDDVKDSLLVGSNIDPGEWEMSWDSDANYQKTEILTGSHFSVEKPTVKEGGFLKFTTINPYTEDIDKVLYIRVANRLKLTVTVSQRRGILTVDGKTGTIDVAAMYYGGLYRFHVLTGNTAIGWETNSDDGTLITMFDEYTPAGNDDGYLTVNIKPNLDEVMREGLITVSRDRGTAVDDVTLNIIQERAPYLTISPGFFDPLGAPTKLTEVEPNFYDYTISVSDPLRYTWQATSTFSESDVSLGNIDGSTKELVSGAHGEKLRIYVKGRKEEQFDGIGKINLELVRKTTTLPISAGKKIKDLRVAAYVTVEVRNPPGESSNIYVYDRNLGGGVPNADTPAEYYNSIEPNKNPEFKGNLSLWNDANVGCASIGDDWRLPTRNELMAIIDHQLEYEATELKAAYLEYGNIKCYFPLVAIRSNFIHADYWGMGLDDNPRNAWALCLSDHKQEFDDTGTKVINLENTGSLLGRCVKTVP